MARVGLSAGVRATTRPRGVPLGMTIDPVFASALTPADFNADAVP
jgi:hypothetical protein